MSTPVFFVLCALTCAKACVGLMAWAIGQLTGVTPASLPAWGGSIGTSLLSVLTFSSVGAMLLAGDARGQQSRWLGLFLLLVGSPFANVLTRNGHPLGGLSALMGLIHLEAALPIVLWRFVSVFPQADQRSEADVLHASAGILALGPIAVSSILLQRIPGQVATYTYWPLLMLALLPAAPLLLSRARCAAPGGRRRVAVFAAGLAVGLVPMSADIVLRTTSGTWQTLMASPSNNRVMTAIAISAFLTTPLTAAYSVLVAQVFDFRLVIRLALRYALARTTMLLLILLPLATLLRHLYEHRGDTIAGVFTGATGVTSITAAGVAMAALAMRGSLIAAVDRRYFRDGIEAEAILTQIVEACRTATLEKEMAVAVGETTSRGLRLRAVALLVRDAASDEFATLYGEAAVLRKDAAIVSLLSTSDLPLVTTDTHEYSLLQRLDPWSRDWVRVTAAHLLVPARNLEGRLLGVLVLGAKKSELEYSRTDRELLTAVGSAIGLCLTRLQQGQLRAAPALRLAESVDEPPARECAECGRVLSSTSVFCSCNNLLEEAHLPHLLAGKYTVERRLGQGGMGVVYRGTDRLLLRPVAIKTLPRSSEEHVSRLRREAQAMARLTHPNLAGIYGIELWQQRPCLVVELLEGGTLATRLKSGPLPTAEVLAVGRQVLQGLSALHGDGMLHRDVKPSNIGLTLSGQAKLLDFGLTRTAGHGMSGDESPEFRTASGALVGTPAYLPPEAFDGDTLPPSLDLWAVAVLLYECATGRHPFRRETVAATYDCIRAGLQDTPLVAGVQAPLERLLRASLSLDRRRRPQSADEFLREINALF